LLALGVLLALLILVLARPLSMLVARPEFSDILRSIAGLAVLYALAAVPAALLKRQMEFRTLALRSLAGTVAGAGTGVTLAWFGYGVWALVFAILVRASIQVAALWWRSTWRPTFRVSMIHYRELNEFSLWSLLSTLTSNCMSHLPTVMIGGAFGPVALGYYAAGSRLMEFLVQMLIMPVQAVGLPAIAALQHQPERIQPFIASTAQALTFVAFPAFCGLMAIAPDAVPFVFGEAWRSSVPIVQALCVVGLVRSVIALFGQVLQGVGRTSWLLLIVVVDHVPRAVVAFVLLPFGINAVVFGMVAIYVAFLPFDIWVIRKASGIDLSCLFRLLAPTLAAALGMAAIVMLWRSQLPLAIPEAAAVGSSVLLGAIVYAALALLTAPALVRDNLSFVLSALQRR
jgi:O-antigen/teichoic acid export membrane protein